MSETLATVVAIEGNYALVRTQGGGCGRCHEAGGCGGANISQMLCGSERNWRVLNPRGAVVGEQVRVIVADGAVRSGAVVLYVLPLLSLVAGAIAGTAFLGESGGIGGAVVGLVVAWIVISRLLRQRDCDPRFQPHIV